MSFPSIATSMSSLYSEMADSSQEEDSRNLVLSHFLFDRNGDCTLREITRSALASATSLASRDLRSIDGTLSQVTSILPREGAIVVNLSHVSAIVQRDRVYVFNPSRSTVQQFSNTLSILLKRRLNKEKSPLTYELHVVDIILQSICRGFERHLNTVSPVVSTVLSSLTSDTSQDVLRRLLPLKTGLSEFSMHVKETHSVILSLLETPEDMEDMFLTEQADAAEASAQRMDNIMAAQCVSMEEGPDSEREGASFTSVYGGGAKEKYLKAARRKATELMLESYGRVLQELTNEIQQLIKSIENTQSIININLDSVRNRYMRLNLHVMMGTLAISSGSLVTGVFGMNLTSGLENHPLAWYVTVGTIAVTSTTLYALCYQYYRNDSKERKKIDDLSALKSLLPHLDEVEEITHNYVMQTGRDSFDKAEFRSMMSTALHRPVHKSEVDLLFDTFDVNHSGELSYKEFMSVLKSRRPLH